METFIKICRENSDLLPTSGTSHERLSTFFIADSNCVAQQYKRSLAVALPWQHCRHSTMTVTYTAQQN